MAIGMFAQTQGDQSNSITLHKSAKDAIQMNDQKPKTDNPDKWGEIGNLGVNYLFVDDGWGIDAAYTFNGFAVDAAYMHSSVGKYSANSFSVGLGWMDHFMITDSFFIGGKVIAAYKSVSSSYDGQSGDDSDMIVLRVNPFLGYALSESLAITAGYNWDFNKFKFSKEYTADFFTVGIKIAF